MTVAQLSDTHVSVPGRLHFGHDSATYLADAVAALNALRPRPLYAVVTGDLVDWGYASEYRVFRAVMHDLELPYFVLPGNHDERDTMRAVLPAQVYRAEIGPRIRYAIDGFAVRTIALDANRRRPWPGARLERGDLAWLEAQLAQDPERPTIVAVHQPPFPCGLPYVDMFGFGGARALRGLLARYPRVGRVIAGHVHHVACDRYAHALGFTAPSSVPQRIPLVLAKGRTLGILHERAAFATHTWEPHQGGFVTQVYRRGDDGRYETAGNLA